MRYVPTLTFDFIDSPDTSKENLPVLVNSLLTQHRGFGLADVEIIIRYQGGVIFGYMDHYGDIILNLDNPPRKMRELQ